MIDRVEKLFRGSRRHLSRSEWAIRRLRLKISENTGPQPGLLMIQIDGLARTQLEAAMRKGRMPFLKKLMTRENYELRTFYSGIPSTTPAVQGELYYGKCCAVPAFSFLDRSVKKIATMFKPDWAKMIEGRLQKDSEGLLKGGSSWSNIYTGGADIEECHFCAASIGWGDIFKGASLLGFLSVVVLQLPSILRFFLLLFVEFFIAIFDMIQGVLKGRIFWDELKFVIPRVLVCVGLREFVTIGAKIDLARGLPIIHVNFVGYDEQAHRRGPGSAFAHWSLGGIDGAIRALHYAAERSTRRDYQVWVFSDHGQEKARSYYHTYKEGIEEAVRQSMDHVGRKMEQRKYRSQQAPSRANWAGLPKPGRKKETADLLTESESETFAVAAMGPVGHVYLATPFTLEEKKIMAEFLVNQKKVPGVLYRLEDGKVIWYHAKGTAILPDGDLSFLPHPISLKKEIASDIVTLCEQEFAGDLILFGWDPFGQPWTFPRESGAHAGPGLNETQGFCLLPAKTRLPSGTKDFIRPAQFRKAALHFLGRESLDPQIRNRPQEEKRHLRIMTYNVHACVGMDGKNAPQRIARIIDHYDPDVVALQEIDLRRQRSQNLDQARIIADIVGMHYGFCPTLACGEGHYGHAVLSRHPLEIVKNETFACGTKFHRKEPRGALWVKVLMNGTQFHFMSTHFGLGKLERLEQASIMMGPEWIGGISLDEPIILCGDFNTSPDSLPYRKIVQRLHDVQCVLEGHKPLKTFAAFFPFTRIDHIFASAHFEPTRIFVPLTHKTRIASDHLPLITDLKVNVAWESEGPREWSRSLQGQSNLHRDQEEEQLRLKD